jgi:hypothetical protein
VRSLADSLLINTAEEGMGRIVFLLLAPVCRDGTHLLPSNATRTQARNMLALPSQLVSCDRAVGLGGQGCAVLPR